MCIGHEHKTQRWKFLCTAFIFSAIAVRAIVPLGYMPGDALAGEFLVLCSQGISQEMVSALPGMEIELSAAPALVDWDDDTLVVLQIPAFERHHASSVPHLI